MNRVPTFITAPSRNRSLVALSYIVTVAFWYHSLTSLVYEHDNNVLSSPGRVMASGTLLHDNRISLSLYNRTVKEAAESYYTRFSEPAPYLCRAEQGKQNLSPTLQKYFNFIASIHTDLKIIFIGDSISAQFAQAFDSAALDVGQEDSVRAKDTMSVTSPDVVCMSISSPIRGGGVSAFWRVTNLLLKENNRWPAHCAWVTKQHWNEGQALTFLSHEYNSTKLVMPSNAEYNQNSRTSTEFWQQKKLASIKTGNVNVVNTFDAAIMRLPHGWLELDYMNNATRINEAIKTTYRVLGATTIVIPTLPLYNNVKSENDWKKIDQINRLIREVARDITESVGDIQYVLVQEFGNLTNQVLVENAKNLNLISHVRDIDYAQQSWEVDFANVFLQRPTKTTKQWPPSHAQVCSSLPSNEAKACPGVKISPDGMHWCVETFGARFTASIACLLGCVYNVARPTHEGVKMCEQRCNDQFMSLAMVDVKG
mmetsp:Transcript_24849/g.49691  ORF Transcript_24849/g.49691 Transcript_24849/m.49691 type:complete len:482 (+) Transcript_24849:100-1545(+)